MDEQTKQISGAFNLSATVNIIVSNARDEDTCNGEKAIISNSEISFEEEVIFEDKCEMSTELDLIPNTEYTVSVSIDGYVIEPVKFTANLMGDNIVTLNALTIVHQQFAIAMPQHRILVVFDYNFEDGTFSGCPFAATNS